MRDGKPDRGALASSLLLDWYDRNARVMPWRIGPQDRAGGRRPDPYHVWLSEVMLQQTTVAAVRDYFRRFTARWPTVQTLAAAEDEQVMAEWAGLGYYARARNLLKCARAVAALGGFPATRDGLLALPGIGPYTASAIAAIAFDEAATVVDGNVERVVARLFAIETPLPRAKQELTRLAATLTPQERPGDHAQAMMDLGATICTPRNPTCALCPLSSLCDARAAGIAAQLPRKAPKAKKPTRLGTLWLARQGDLWLVETRPERGLLGGMIGFPGDDWDGAGGPAPLHADWETVGEVRHTFTHFHLILTILSAETTAPPERGTFSRISPAALPTLFRKAFDLAASRPRPST
ncbi:MAG: A/G-specific adenine glycosylase [Cypionkella sp.]|jgi:A/G-specific adenine glycosylase|nr:A/G-specific adenine glycosylase [Cypionkella sp.]